MTKKYDIIFVNASGRKNCIDRKQVDIYTYPIIKRISNKYKMLLIDINAFENSNSYPCDFLPMRIVSIICKLLSFSVRWSVEEKTYFNNINIKIRSLFNTNIDFSNIICSSLKAQIIDDNIYSKLFKHFSPKVLIYVNNGSLNGIIKSANELGIITIELQHGAISHLHTAWNTGNFDECVVPKYFFTFGKYWHETIKMKCQKIAIGFPYMNLVQKDISKKVVRNDHSIIIISDCNLTREVFVKITLELADVLKNYRIYYKLRSEEYKNWKQLYPYSFQTIPNITVIDNNNKPLYEYFMEAKYLVGPSSTTIYEGLAHDMVVFLVKSRFYAEMKPLVDKNVIFVVSDAEEILLKILNNIVPVESINKEIFFNSNSLQNIDESLAEIIKL